MSGKISKKFIIVLSVFVTVVLLGSWLIVSGTAESIIDSIEYEQALHCYVEPEGGVHLLDDLKPGKYLLQREWGLDETDYIEVFDDQTVQFVGEYWIDKDADEKERLGNHYDETVHLNERNAYIMHEVAQAVLFTDFCADGGGEGFSYIDENTFEIGRRRDEINDVVNYDHEPNRPDVPRERADYVIAHYIYTE